MSTDGRAVQYTHHKIVEDFRVARQPPNIIIAGGGRRARTADAWVGHLWDAGEREREGERETLTDMCAGRAVRGLHSGPRASPSLAVCE